MPTEPIERKFTKSIGVPPPEPEHLPCPRCNSTNTKFCYYNNYNFSQPRHFCKGCRRYWTHGGTLRDIPVGGGTRKRSRTVSVPPLAVTSSAAPPSYGEAKPGFNYGSFTSLLGSNGPGFNGLGGGFGSVGGPGFMSPMWPFQGVIIGDTWPLQNGENAAFGGDCFALPELAISTPGNYHK